MYLQYAVNVRRGHLLYSGLVLEPIERLLVLSPTVGVD